jgi:7,8-dihydropterin-6-yl-methyl-4-(beta-D-ribofuranosyl)aminobenzene 5'-phosphate synthase
MKVNLETVDHAEVIILSDNYCEQVILSTEMVVRPGGLTVRPGEKEVQLKAEHAFSALVRLFKDDEIHTVMIDTGRSGSVVTENASCLGIDLDDVEAVVISHSHLDHVGGLARVADSFTHTVPVYAHPDAYLERYLKQPSGNMMRFPDFRPDLYQDLNLEFRTHTKPVIMAGSCLLATGQIPRRTAFEKGFPPQMAVRDGALVPDVEVWDDQAIVFKVKNRGPVVISGCGHAGIVNTVMYGLELTGADKPLAVIGGFHLCWPTPEEVIRQTIGDIKELNPDYVVPCHCTGWDANHRFAVEMPDRFVLSTVGATIRF